jgi:hypothetical protein
MGIVNTKKEQYIEEFALQALTSGELSKEEANELLAEIKIKQSLPDLSFEEINEAAFINTALQINNYIINNKENAAVVFEYIDQTVVHELFFREMIVEEAMNILVENKKELPDYLRKILDKQPPLVKIEPDNVEVKPLTLPTKELVVAGRG